jgi:GGDEF domain-containing protein
LIHRYDIHERKTTEKALRQQAWTDPLTSLLNRRSLTYALTLSVEVGNPFTLLYIDLGGFKMVNDSSVDIDQSKSKNFYLIAL